MTKKRTYSGPTYARWAGTLLSPTDGREIPAEGMPLETTPRTPAACRVFPPDELDARIRRYAELAAAGLPLFGGAGVPAGGAA